MFSNKNRIVMSNCIFMKFSKYIYYVCGPVGLHMIFTCIPYTFIF